MKILLIGNSGSGKSCVIMRYTEQKFINNFYNTIGVDFVCPHLLRKSKSYKKKDSKSNYKLYLFHPIQWDTAGQDRFKNITSSYYRGAHGIILVYDITDKNSFESIQSWIKEIEQYADEQISMILIGNKSDLDERRQVSYEEAKGFSKI